MAFWWERRAAGGRRSLVLESAVLSGSYWTDLASSQKRDFLTLALMTKVFFWGHPLVSAGLGDSPPGLPLTWLSLDSHMTLSGLCPWMLSQLLSPGASTIHLLLHGGGIWWLAKYALSGVFGISECLSHMETTGRNLGNTRLALLCDFVCMHLIFSGCRWSEWNKQIKTPSILRVHTTYLTLLGPGRETPYLCL